MILRSILSLSLVAVFCHCTLVRADDLAVLALLEKRCASCHREDQEPILHGSINLATLLTSHGDAGSDAEAIVKRILLPEESKKRMPKNTAKPNERGYEPPLSKADTDLLQAWAKGQSTPSAIATSNGQTLSAAQFPSIPADAPTPAAATSAKPQGSEPTSQPVTRDFISMRDEIKAIATDLATLDSGLQPFARYITFTNLHNLRDAAGRATESDAQLTIYRAALGKLLNSVSRGPRIVSPTPIDTARTLYRIDLRHYGWSPSDWESYVASGYPYALRAVDVRSETEIAERTRSSVAWVRADWFVFAASQPPLYHQLLQLPATEQELEHQLGVDTNANLRAGHALRAGFRHSGVSQGNRLIERHEAGVGMYWKSYDFTPLRQDNGHDLFRSPLGPVGAGLTRNPDREFRHDGGEIIFTQPNGLHGYLLATADGKRIDRGPSEIVRDKDRPDGTIINGISCMHCHSEGMKQHRFDGYHETDEPLIDDVKKIVLAAGLDREETQLVEALYASDTALHNIMQADEKAYLSAVNEATAGHHTGSEPVTLLYNRFKKEITLETLAAEFGEQDDTFLLRLKHSHDADMESIAAQLNAGMGFPRATWLEQFSKITEALAYRLMPCQPIPYAEFTSGNAKAGGNEGRVVLNDGGSLTIATDKPHYKAGELLTLRLHSTESAYIRIYHKSAANEVQQIFPNAGHPDNFVRGGQTILLPSAGDRFAFRMKAPFGTEIILAIASPVQFTDLQSYTTASAPTPQAPQRPYFQSYPGEQTLRTARYRGTKGLEVEVTPEGSHTSPQPTATPQTRPARRFEARAVYQVTEY